LLDTVDPPMADELLAQLEGVPKIDYVVSQHAEQDHSGTIPRVLENTLMQKFKDYRIMFDKMGDQIDAVVIATPDHTHAIIAKEAMRRGKHVFVQKPLTHSVYEARVLTETARKYKVATQMGNQGNSDDDIRKLSELIWDGAIGEIEEVHAWTNRPIWPQGLERPTETPLVPNTLDWDLFIGPAKISSISSFIYSMELACMVGFLEPELSAIWPVILWIRHLKH